MWIQRTLRRIIAPLAKAPYVPLDTLWRIEARIREAMDDGVDYTKADLEPAYQEAVNGRRARVPTLATVLTHMQQCGEIRRVGAGVYRRAK